MFTRRNRATCLALVSCSPRGITRAARNIVGVICVISCLLGLTNDAHGQAATATLTGVVLDETSSAIPDVQVILASPATGLQRQVKTDSQGIAVFPLLPPGRYTVTAQKDGFAAAQVKDLVLNVGDDMTIRLRMTVAPVDESVTVTAEPTRVSTSPAVGTVVDRQFVENLPLNGRSFQSLITLTPGVVLTPSNNGNPGQFSVNGQRANANYLTVDGVSANIETFGSFASTAAGALPAFTVSGTTQNLVSVEALQEFRIQTSTYAPEFGRQPGGQISLVTRSGTNRFAGSLFEYVRNDVFDANDWFANSRNLKKPPLRLNDFGGVFGGPVQLPLFGAGGRSLYSGRDRTFFFVSYEGLRLRQPQTALTEVPSLEIRQTAPAGLRPYLDAFPLPTGPAQANGFAEAAAVYSDQTTLDSTAIRIDHAASQWFSVFGRYSYAPSSGNVRTPTTGAGLSTLRTNVSQTQTLTLGATMAFSPRVTDELRVNYSRGSSYRTSTIDDFGGAVPFPDALAFPSGISRDDGLFVFSVSGGQSVRHDVGGGSEQRQRQINIVNNLSAIVGPHQLKFGVDYRRLAPLIGSAYLLQVNFNGIGTTAPGAPPPSGTLQSGQLSSATLSSTAAPREPIFHNLSLYAQDTWRALRRLTFTYGVRWELNTAPRERNGQEPFTAVGLEDPLTASLGPRGPLYETTYGNIAPRVGAAYQLTETSGRETTLRGGFGVFYDLGGVGNGVYQQFPFLGVGSIPAGTLFPFVDPAIAAAPPLRLTPLSNTSILLVDPNFELPLIYQWNVTVDRSFGSNQAVTVGYVGAAGRRLHRPEAIFGSAIVPAGALSLSRSNGSSNYQALQAQFRRRLSQGLQSLFSYTWSKSLDTNSADTGVLAPTERLDPRTNWGPSAFDVRHVLTGAITYDLPAPALGRLGRALLSHFSVDTIVAARSATPIDVSYLTDLGFGSFSARPDLNPSAPLYLEDSAYPGGKRINAAAFDYLTPGAARRQGTLGRNAVRGFGAWQVDLGLRRQFNLTERVNLQVRAEAFNLFNHPNFGPPSGTVTNPNTFGLPTLMLGRSLGGTSAGLNALYQIGGPRSMQFALKLHF